MNAIASQITSRTNVCSCVYSGQFRNPPQVICHLTNVNISPRHQIFLNLFRRWRGASFCICLRLFLPTNKDKMRLCYMNKYLSTNQRILHRPMPISITQLTMDVESKCVVHLHSFLPTELPREEFNLATSCDQGFVSVLTRGSERTVDFKVSENLDVAKCDVQPDFNTLDIFISSKIQMAYWRIRQSIWPKTQWPLSSKSALNASDCEFVLDAHSSDWSTADVESFVGPGVQASAFWNCQYVHGQWMLDTVVFKDCLPSVWVISTYTGFHSVFFYDIKWVILCRVCNDNCVVWTLEPAVKRIQSYETEGTSTFPHWLQTMMPRYVVQNLL